MQGQVIVSQIALALTTADSVDLVIPTYQYLRPGTIHVYAKGSASATPVLLTVMINGSQVLRRVSIPYYGTAGTLDTSANLITSVTTWLGGRLEVNAAAASGTPTVDILITHDGVPMVGGALGTIGKFLGR